MKIEAVKLSPKRGGNGYVSSYSVSIGKKEAMESGMEGAEHIVKIVDDRKGQISFKRKGFTVTEEMVTELTSYKMATAGRSGKAALHTCLNALSIENLADISLLIAMGRDCDADLHAEPGEERFLRYYGERGSSTVVGKSKEDLIEAIVTLIPAVRYLALGWRMVNAPMGSDIDRVLKGTE